MLLYFGLSLFGSREYLLAEDCKVVSWLLEALIEVGASVRREIESSEAIIGVDIDDDAEGKILLDKWGLPRNYPNNIRIMDNFGYGLSTNNIQPRIILGHTEAKKKYKVNIIKIGIKILN